MVNYEATYSKAKPNLLADKSICQENRDLFAKFFEFEENKLKRINGLRVLDHSCYHTLNMFVYKFRNVNKWFSNKPFRDLTEEDIKKVYNDLEDGKFLNKNGKPFENLSDSYYSKILKSKPFDMVGKADLCRSIILSTKNNNSEVRFITEEDFNKLVSQAYNPLHNLLIRLGWDIGENIGALLQLRKSDFHKQKNPHTDEPEYRINLRKETLKRSRRPRSEITNYNETVQLLDQILPDMNDSDLIFDFEYGNAKKIIDRAAERAKIKCSPGNDKVTWKDLRSGMACDLLKKGWSTDEVNARLGHRPSSAEIDKYINFLAMDRHTPKKKIQEYTINNLKEQLEETREKEKLQTMRLDSLQKQIDMMREEIGYVTRLEGIKKESSIISL